MVTLSDKIDSQARVRFVIGAVLVSVGLGCIVLGLYDIVARDNLRAVGLVLLGGALGLGGIALVRAGRSMARGAEAGRARREANPDRPWLERDDWARGTVRYDTKKDLFTAWGVAAFWNSVFSYVPLAVWEEVVEKGDQGALIGLIFPFVGVCVLVWAVRETLRYLKFGSSELRLRAVPARPGGFLTGVVHVKAQLEPSDGYHVKLTCIHRTVTGTGRGQTTHDDIVWQQQHVVESELRGGDSRSTRTPISVPLPVDAEETTLDDERDRVLWRLEVSAEIFGVDYEASFEVPVFRTDCAEPLADDYVEGEDWAASYRRADDRDASVVRASDCVSGVQIERPAHGVTEFYSPPGRRDYDVVSSLTMFMILLTWILFEGEAPIVFPIVLGVFDVLLVAVCLPMWFGSTRIRIDVEEIIVTSRVLGVASTKVFPARDVEALDLSPDMWRCNTLYHDIVARCRDGGKVTLLPSVRGERGADRLVDEIRKCLPDAVAQEAESIT